MDKLAGEIRKTIEPVVIRRNLLDLDEKERKNIPIPEIARPVTISYELDDELKKFYDKVVKTFNPEFNAEQSTSDANVFKGAIYLPFLYERGLSFSDLNKESIPEDSKNREEQIRVLNQKNLYEFMRRLLIKRLESSPGAFRKSIERLKNAYHNIQSYVETKNKFHFSRKLMIFYMKKLYSPEELEEELKNKKKYGKINTYDPAKFKKKDEFLADIKKDIELFENLIKEFDATKLSEKDKDPKLRKLKRILKKLISKGKQAVIFTEYKDTADYLKEKLESEFEGKILYAFGNLSEEDLKKINEHFDASQKKNDTSPDYWILLTTDKLSEGINLNRAVAVINYDIPWNPVRVIQRVGRVKRIGNVSKEICIYNFLPTAKGNEEIKLKEIVEKKLHMMNSILGGDTQILGFDETTKPSELFKTINIVRDDNEVSFYTKIKEEYRKIIEKYPENEKEIQNIPLRVKVVKEGDEDELFVIFRRGNDLYAGYKKYDENTFPVIRNFEAVLDKLRVGEDKVHEHKKQNISEHFWKHYEEILKFITDYDQYTEYISEKDSPVIYKVVDTIDSILWDDEIFNELSYEHKIFLNNLVFEIRDYRKSSWSVYERILNWKKIVLDTKKSKEEKIKNLKNEIEKLRDVLGDDFLEKTKSNTGTLEEQGKVIIAIENQKR